jgi:hypothetical protein
MSAAALTRRVDDASSIGDPFLRTDRPAIVAPDAVRVRRPLGFGQDAKSGNKDDDIYDMSNDLVPTRARPGRRRRRLDEACR